MAKLSICTSFSATHGTASRTTSTFLIELHVIGAIHYDFVLDVDSKAVDEKLSAVLEKLQGGYLDEIVGRATVENVALYILWSMPRLPVNGMGITVRNCLTNESVEIDWSDMPSADYEYLLCYKLACSCLVRRIIPRARALAEECLRLQPDFVDAEVLLGRCFLASGKLDLAMVHFRALTNRNPICGEAWRNIGNIALCQNDFSSAKDALCRAVEIMPRSALACQNLGYLYMLKHEWRMAMRWLDSAITLDPEMWMAYKDRAKVYQSINEPDKEREDQVLAETKSVCYDESTWEWIKLRSSSEHLGFE